MSFKLFAAIDVGSFELRMKIFEMSQKKGLKEIDFVRQRVDLGTDTYRTGKISYDRMDELCGILKGFRDIMSMYQVDSYRACGTSAIRETRNTAIVLDEIRLRTGLRVTPLSNSEQRFLDYKSAALKMGQFDNIISAGTAFVDIGGGSVQVSLFSDSRLMATVNLDLGILRLRTKLNMLQPTRDVYERFLSELVDNEVHVFKKLYLKKLNIQNIIVVDDYLPQILDKVAQESSSDSITAESYVRFVEILKTMSPEQMAKELNIPMENASLFMPSAFVILHLIRAAGAGRIWIPGVSLSDGIAYDYAEKNKIIKSTHDFDKDIISCVDNISLRYQGGRRVMDELVKCSLAIFDSMKKLHGLDKRERLLLELAARIRDCGRFVSMNSPAESAFSIIMGTEIIGLSHLERHMVAAIVRNSYIRETDYEDASDGFDDKSYTTVTKLTAILMLAAGMARSPRKRYNDVKAQLKEDELLIKIDSKDDLTLEKGLSVETKALFEEVFGVHPVLRMKKSITV